LSFVNMVEHLKVAHQNLIFVSVNITASPRIAGQRYEIEMNGEGCYLLSIRFGYLEKPDVPAVLDLIKETNPIFDKNKASFFINRENIFATDLPGMALWREKLFSFIFKNELSATRYFELPKDRVVEVGAQVEI
jgi:KUP system potassium uptake protein